MKSIKVKSWEKKDGDLSVKVEMWQDGPNNFEVAKYRLGSTVPVLYRFSDFNQASADYSLFIELNDGEISICKQLQEENKKLHELCAAAQCWLDAAGHLANGHATKCALQKNADSFRQEYGKITS